MLGIYTGKWYTKAVACYDDGIAGILLLQRLDLTYHIRNYVLLRRIEAFVHITSRALWIGC